MHRISLSTDLLVSFGVFAGLFWRDFKPLLAQRSALAPNSCSRRAFFLARHACVRIIFFLDFFFPRALHCAAGARAKAGKALHLVTCARRRAALLRDYVVQVTHTHTHTHTHTVQREGGRQGGRQGERERERERGRDLIPYICMIVQTCV